MLLTNLGAAEGKNNSTLYNRKLKDWNCTKEGKAKILKALERGSTRLAEYSNLDMHQAFMITGLVTWYVDTTSFWKGSAEQLTSGTPNFRPYENLWRSPIGQSLHCAITGYKYHALSYFREPLSTVNWPTPIFSHHNCRAQSWPENLLRQTQNLSQPKFLITSAKIFKDCFACRIVSAADHQYPRIIQRIFRLQNCLNRKPSISQKY